MVDSLKYLSQENDPGKLGIIVALIILISSAVPNMETELIKLSNPFKFQTLLLGISMFFFAYGIKLNSVVKIETINGKPYLASVLPEVLHH